MPSPFRPAVTAVVVVVPAHDEEQRIATCLTSVGVAAGMLRRTRDVTVTVTVVLDRCEDQTGAVAVLTAPVALLAVDLACVGAARAAGVRDAVDRLGLWDPARVLVVNTDADCTVPPDWLVEHVGLAADHDLVLGEVEPDPTEMTVASLALWWDRHPVGRGSLHGANLGVRLDAYLRAGGFPDVAQQEDVLLVRALRATGASVVGGTRVVTSGRREGRVPQGFADYLVGLDHELEGRLS